MNEFLEHFDAVDRGVSLMSGEQNRDLVILDEDGNHFFTLLQTKSEIPNSEGTNRKNFVDGKSVI